MDDYEEPTDVWANGPKEITADVDPNRCYQVSFKREGVGRLLTKTKVKVTWELIVEGEEHTISIYHSQLSGKKIVVLDGEAEYEEQDFFDAGLDYTFPFKIEGRSISIVVSDDAKLGWYYDLYIDGLSLQDLDEKRARIGQQTVTVPPPVTTTTTTNKKESSSEESSSEEESGSSEESSEEESGSEEESSEDEDEDEESGSDEESDSD